MIGAIGSSQYNSAISQSARSGSYQSAASANQRGAANLSLLNDGDMAAGQPESSIARSSQLFNYNTEQEVLNILA